MDTYLKSEEIEEICHALAERDLPVAYDVDDVGNAGPGRYAEFGHLTQAYAGREEQLPYREEQDSPHVAYRAFVVFVLTH